MVRGITYKNQIFKSSDFALMTKRFFNNQDGIIDGCTISTNANNIIISSGYFIASGYYNNITSDEIITAINGTLVYEIDLSKENTDTEFNQGKFKIINTGARKDDLFKGGTIYQLEFATITTDNNVASFEQIIESVTKDFQTQLNEKENKSTRGTVAPSGGKDGDRYFRYQ